ncbi:hypothetical protein J3R83DRAFT_5067 [Lanmaoa asiatica]|nr:hypothetical protein J3R83DRAFT_5067 [Lanmaoa asiatica]
MTNWQSLSELSTDLVVFDRLMHALLGLYGWEVMLTLDFDWAVISGKRKFRWPLIFYFAGRYLLLFAMIGILPVTPHSAWPVSIFHFARKFLLSLILYATHFDHHSMAIWSQNKWIVGIIVLLILGHWSLILQGVLLQVNWVQGVGCTIIKSNTTILAATFIYSMSFDLIVLCLTAYKLAWTRRISGTSGIHSKLVRMVFSDGLVYFILAFLANLFATVFMIIDLNAVMSVIFNVPAAMASTIMASRVVRRLYNFNLTIPDVYHSDERSGGVVFGNPRARPAREPTAIHVEVDTHRQTHSLSEVPQYAMKPSGDFLSLNDHEEHAKLAGVL